MGHNFERQGFVSVLGGMNAALSPSLLADTQYAYGVNVSSRGGLLHTRPRWQRVDTSLPSGKFQGAALYRSRQDNYLALVVSGVLYLVDLVTLRRTYCQAFKTTEFDHAYFCNADRFLVVQNGIYYPYENWPIIMDDRSVVYPGSIQLFYAADGGDVATLVRLREVDDYEAKRLPIGTKMAYGHGRLFLVASRIWDSGLVSGSAQWLYVDKEKYFIAGDIVQPDNADEVLVFTETDYLSEGGAFSLPTESGQIRAFDFFRNAATGTGAGELVVFGEHGVSAFAISAPRSQWKDINLAQVLFTDVGAATTRAITPLNGDLAFRSADGIRLISYTHSDAAVGSGSLTNLPQSMEVNSLLDEDSDALRERSSMVWADNRLISTVFGHVDDDPYNSHYFTGILPLDTYVVGSTGSSSSLRSASNPAYDGVWNGLDVLQVLRLPGTEADYFAAICRVGGDTSGGRLELWKLDDTATYDGESDRPVCRVQFRSFDFAKPIDLKEFKYAEVWISGLKGTVDFTLYFRPEDYALWTQTNSITVEACETGAEQQRWCLRFAIPPDTKYYDAATNRDTRRGYSFDFLLEWTGVATIEKMACYALVQPSPSPNLGCDAETCVPLFASNSAGLDVDLLDYRMSVLTPVVDPGLYYAVWRLEGSPLVYFSEPYLKAGNWYQSYYCCTGDAGYLMPYIWNTLTGELVGPVGDDGTVYTLPYTLAPGEIMEGEIQIEGNEPVLGSSASGAGAPPNATDPYPGWYGLGGQTAGDTPVGPGYDTANNGQSPNDPTVPEGVDVFAMLQVTGIDTVTRDTSFEVTLTQGRSVEVANDFEAYVWDDAGTTVTVSFTDPAGGSDAVVTSTYEVVWSAAGTATISVNIAGGVGTVSGGTLRCQVSLDGSVTTGSLALNVLAHTSSLLSVGSPYQYDVLKVKSVSGDITVTVPVTNMAEYSVQWYALFIDSLTDSQIQDSLGIATSSGVIWLARGTVGPAVDDAFFAAVGGPVGNKVWTTNGPGTDGAPAAGETINVAIKSIGALTTAGVYSGVLRIIAINALNGSDYSNYVDIPIQLGVMDLADMITTGIAVEAYVAGSTPDLVNDADGRDASYVNATYNFVPTIQSTTEGREVFYGANQSHDPVEPGNSISLVTRMNVYIDQLTGATALRLHGGPWDGVSNSYWYDTYEISLTTAQTLKYLSPTTGKYSVASKAYSGDWPKPAAKTLPSGVVAPSTLYICLGTYGLAYDLTVWDALPT